MDTFTTNQTLNISSKNSTVARNGFRAEKVMCMQEDTKLAFEQVFGLPIVALTVIHGEKHDIKVKFENGTETTIQNKDGGDKTGRGHSVDRRNVNAYKNEPLATLLKTLCLPRTYGDCGKPVVSADVSKTVINMCILGEKEEERPKYFTHTTSDKDTGKIISMSICTADDLMTFMYGTLYKEMVPKRTCVHLSPNCYLQRKGGGKTDAKPDDIQMKFKFTEAIEALFTPIFIQTMPL